MPHFTENYLGYLLAKCSHTVSASFHQCLKEHGVSVNTWRILASINDKPATVNELVEMVLTSQPTLSKTLDRLERDKLITRKRDNEHRRKVYIHITENGKTIIEKLIPLANKYEQERFKHMKPEDKQKLKQLLQELISYHS